MYGRYRRDHELDALQRENQRLRDEETKRRLREENDRLRRDLGLDEPADPRVTRMPHGPRRGGLARR